MLRSVFNVKQEESAVGSANGRPNNARSSNDEDSKLIFIKEEICEDLDNCRANEVSDTPDDIVDDKQIKTFLQEASRTSRLENIFQAVLLQLGSERPVTRSSSGEPARWQDILKDDAARRLASIVQLHLYGMTVTRNVSWARRLTTTKTNSRGDLLLLFAAHLVEEYRNWSSLPDNREAMAILDGIRGEEVGELEMGAEEAGEIEGEDWSLPPHQGKSSWCTTNRTMPVPVDRNSNPGSSTTEENGTSKLKDDEIGPDSEDDCWQSSGSEYCPSDSSESKGGQNLLFRRKRRTSKVSSSPKSMKLEGKYVVSDGELKCAAYKKPYRFCPFCNKSKSKLSLHIKTQHKDLECVAKALNLPRRERIVALDSFRKDGILKVNKEQAKSDNPFYQRERSTKKDGALSMCFYCSGFYAKSYIKRHTIVCQEQLNNPPVSIVPVALFSSEDD